MSEYRSTQLGDRLREERDRLGLNQEDAALLAGVSRAMWSRYERGIALPGGEHLLHLQGHGIDVNYVLGGSRLLSESTLTDEEEELLRSYRSTDHEGRQAVLRMARMECSRMSEPTHAYAVKPQTSSAVLLHDAPPPAKKKPPAR